VNVCARACLSICLSVCPCVCVCVCVCVRVCGISSCERNTSNIYERILTKFCGEVGMAYSRSRLDFGGNPDFFVDPGEGRSQEFATGGGTKEGYGP